ncbi:MAG: ABC transporter permease [Caldilineae bacterium]|nr:MAG: ABC transporter permease [Caldilineae bacterium]
MEFAFFITTFTAAIRSGTPLLFAAVGEIYAERAGVLNLGVEGMMLVGAVIAFITGVATDNVWLALLAGLVAGGLLSLIHAFLTVTLHADQVVSGLALTIFGGGLSAFLGRNYVGVRGPQFPDLPLPILSDIPVLGPILFHHDILVYITYLLVPFTAYYIHRTRPGLSLRAVGEDPATADVMGVNVARTRYIYVFIGGALAGVAGANLTLALTPGWIEGITAGQGWIAVALVIFAFWEPWRAMLGAYLIAWVQSLQFSLQTIGITVPSYFLDMTPYLFTILVLVIATQERVRRHLGAPAALGVPYVRGER